MKLRFMKRSITTAFLTSAGLAASLGFASPAHAQGANDLQDMLKDGVELLQRGRMDEADAKFRAVLAADPSNEDAYALVKSTDHKIFLEMLKAGGSPQQVAKRLLDLSHRSETAKSQDEGTIRPLVNQAVNDRDFGRRTSAVNQLVASHGEYAVPQLAAFLGSNDIDSRANAIIALSRLGDDAVMPLAASLATGTAMQKRNVADLLGRIGDERAVPALLALAAAGKDAASQAAAASAAKLGGSGSAVDAYLGLATAFFHGNPQTLRNYDGTYTVWSAQNGALVGTDVPRFIYNYELAEQACYDALATDPSSAKARAMIAVTSFAELSAWDGLSAEARADESMAGTASALEGARALAASTGSNDLLAALGMAMHMGNGGAAAMICDTIADLGNAGDLTAGNSLTEALTHADKTIRYGAAFALLRLDPAKSFPTSNLVAKLAGDAASEASIRQILVIDSDTKNAMNVQRALNGAGFHAVAATDGAGGLMMAKATGAFDAVVVRNTLSDITTFQVLDELRRDFRTNNITTIVMASGGELGAAKSQFDSRGIGGVAPTSEDARGVINAVNEALGDSTDANAAMANALSVQASNALAHVCGAAFNLKDAQPGLVSALRDGAADEVRLAALGALANVAGPDAAGAITAVLSRSENSAEIRAAAGVALGKALRGGKPADGTFNALLEAMGDASVAVRTAAGGALGSADLTDAQRAKVMMSRRVN